MIPPVRLKRTFRRATRQAHVIERCFEMNTEYERGRPGVRAHFMSGDVIFESRHRPAHGRRLRGSDELFELPDQLLPVIRTQVRAIDEILCGLENQ